MHCPNASSNLRDEGAVVVDDVGRAERLDESPAGLRGRRERAACRHKHLSLDMSYVHISHSISHSLAKGASVALPKAEGNVHRMRAFGLLLQGSLLDHFRKTGVLRAHSIVL